MGSRAARASPRGSACRQHSGQGVLAVGLWAVRASRAAGHSTPPNPTHHPTSSPMPACSVVLPRSWLLCHCSHGAGPPGDAGQALTAARLDPDSPALVPVVPHVLPERTRSLLSWDTSNAPAATDPKCEQAHVQQSCLHLTPWAPTALCPAPRSVSSTSWRTLTSPTGLLAPVWPCRHRPFTRSLLHGPADAKCPALTRLPPRH